jgi:hypothetical protein
MVVDEHHKFALSEKNIGSIHIRIAVILTPKVYFLNA